MNIKHIPVVLGTARAERASEKIAQAATKHIETLDGYSTELVDVRDHITEAVTIPPWGTGGANEKSTKWQKIVQDAHALILVVPEYNHSFPGELKLLLDSLWEDYQDMGVGLIGVSAGTLGAARVVDHIKPVLIELRMHPVKENVHISKVKEAIDDAGAFTNEKTPEYLTSMVDDISRISSALK